MAMLDIINHRIIDPTNDNSINIITEEINKLKLGRATFAVYYFYYAISYFNAVSLIRFEFLLKALFGKKNI